MVYIVPLIAGFLGVAVMTFFLRRARFFHLPETQMIRAIGSMLVKDPDKALLPGTVVHFAGGIFFAYCYAFFLTTAPDAAGNGLVVVIVCTMMGLVHGLMVTLFLVISVAQYHPVERFRKLGPGDMASHVISHIAYGLTVGLVLGYLAPVLGA